MVGSRVRPCLSNDCCPLFLSLTGVLVSLLLIPPFCQDPLVGRQCSPFKKKVSLSLEAFQTFNHGDFRMRNGHRIMPMSCSPSVLSGVNIQDFSQQPGEPLVLSRGCATQRTESGEGKKTNVIKHGILFTLTNVHVLEVLDPNPQSRKTPNYSDLPSPLKIRRLPNICLQMVLISSIWATFLRTCPGSGCAW